jgi:hypothetical protein
MVAGCNVKFKTTRARARARAREKVSENGCNLQPLPEKPALVRVFAVSGLLPTLQPKL